MKEFASTKLPEVVLSLDEIRILLGIVSSIPDDLIRYTPENSSDIEVEQAKVVIHKSRIAAKAPFVLRVIK